MFDFILSKAIFISVEAVFCIFTSKAEGSTRAKNSAETATPTTAQRAARYAPLSNLKNPKNPRATTAPPKTESSIFIASAASGFCAHAPAKRFLSGDE